MKYNIISFFAILTVLTVSCGRSVAPDESLSLPRAHTPETLAAAMDSVWTNAQRDSITLHSIMIVRDDSVIYEHWDNGASPDSAHALYSVSKTFTSLGVGLAINEGILDINDRLVDIFPEYVPDSASENLRNIKVVDLLTMSCGHAVDPFSRLMEGAKNDSNFNFVKEFMALPVEHKPGETFCYNTIGTMMLSAAIQKRSGEKLVDYLQSRLFEPLGIENAYWEESTDGISFGGTGLHLKTEDLAKTGLLILNKGVWNGKQIVPEAWIDSMQTKHIDSVPGAICSIDFMKTNTLDPADCDWLHGYGYQMWRSRHNSFRADGAYGQYILILPDQNAVIAITADVRDMQIELNYIWDFVLPLLDKWAIYE